LMAQSNSARDNCELLTRIHEEVCMPWASTHGAKFAPNKYQLCHLTRKRQSPTDSMTINGSVSVAPKETVKYLGVCLDSKLNGKAQVNSNKTKALKTVGALFCLAGFTWGAHFTRTRQIIYAVFLPQLTHSCSAWYTPYGEKGHTKGVITSLSSVLYRAQRAITGAFKATSKAALQIETFSSPIHVHMDRIVCQAALRIATSPAYQAIIATRSKKRTRIISPLEKLTARLERKTGTYIKDLEIITPFAAPLWWIPPRVDVKPIKEIAEEAHKKLLRETNALVVYSDGSGINKKIGAAAVAPHRTIKSFLGSTANYTVYSAELYGIILATILASMPNHDKSKITICGDNQAAIRAVENPGNSSGQHLVEFIIVFIEKLRSKGVKVELHWVPAHIGIDGNESADIAAKQATGWRQKKSKRGKLVEYDSKHTAKPAMLARPLRNAQKSTLAKNAHKQWTKYWEENEKGRGLYALQPTPSKAVLCTPAFPRISVRWRCR